VRAAQTPALRAGRRARPSSVCAQSLGQNSLLPHSRSDTGNYATRQTERVLKTRFTELFGLDHPIMSAPMAAGTTGGDIAAAVSEAGALGTFGAMRADVPAAAWAVEEIVTIRLRTERPFGVGFITPFIAFSPELFDAVL